MHGKFAIRMSDSRLDQISAETITGYALTGLALSHYTYVYIVFNIKHWEECPQMYPHGPNIIALTAANERRKLSVQIIEHNHSRAKGERLRQVQLIAAANVPAERGSQRRE